MVHTITKKQVAGVTAAAVVREGSTGRVILPVVQACAGTTARPRRNCRGLRLVHGGGRVTQLAAEAQVAPEKDVREFAVTTTAAPDAQVRPRPELAFYRKYTEAMIRRYVTMATETGRVPSLLGRELFRAKVTSYKMHSFDDAVIFCIDMERCLQKLQAHEKPLIKRIAMQGYTQGETAGIMGWSLRDVVRKYAQAVDRFTAILLAAGMMEPLRKLAEARERATTTPPASPTAVPSQPEAEGRSGETSASPAAEAAAETSCVEIPVKGVTSTRTA